MPLSLRAPHKVINVGFVIPHWPVANVPFLVECFVSTPHYEKNCLVDDGVLEVVRHLQLGVVRSGSSHLSRRFSVAGSIISLARELATSLHEVHELDAWLDAVLHLVDAEGSAVMNSRPWFPPFVFVLRNINVESYTS